MIAFAVIAPLSLAGAGCAKQVAVTSSAPAGIKKTSVEQSSVTSPTSSASVSIQASSASGTSNADLQKDLTNVDAQIHTLNNDSASIDRGLNDKPIQQAE